MARPRKHDYSALLESIRAFISKNPEANQAQICAYLKLPKNGLARLKSLPEFAEILSKFNVPRLNRDKIYEEVKRAKMMYPNLGIKKLSLKMGFSSSRLSVMRYEDHRINSLFENKNKKPKVKLQPKIKTVKFFSKVPKFSILTEKFNGCELAEKYRQEIDSGNLKYGETLGINFHGSVISIAALSKDSNLRIWDGKEEYVEDKFYTNGYRRLYRLKPNFK